MHFDCLYQESVKSRSYNVKTYSFYSSFEDLSFTLYLRLSVVATIKSEEIDEGES